MADLKILVYKPGAGEPDSKFILPLKGAGLVARLLPGAAAAALAQEGVVPAEAEVVEREEPRGALVEIESDVQRVVVMVE